MVDAAKLVVVLEAQSRKLQNQLVDVTRQIDRFAAQSERRFDQMQRRNSASFDKLGASMRGSLGRLQGVLAPVVGTIGLREIVRYSDAWSAAGNKIAAASQVAGIQARSLDELKDSANGARQSFGEYVDLYARLLRVSPGVAATELEVARATDIVAKSLKAGGASAQEQTAALIQLGQAIGSGFLQGDELRSLRENAPLLAKAIADEFGVTIGELKKLGAEGKITSDRVFKAIIAGGAEIEAAFNTTQSTIGDAFMRIENEFTSYIGTAGQATGATQGLIDALNYVAKNFSEIAPVVANFAAILAGAFAGRAIVGGIAAATVALAGFLSALGAGTGIAAAFTAALGPIGLLAGAAAAAMALMAYAQGDAARAAAAHAEALGDNQNKLDLARDSSDQYRKALQKQIALQLKAAEAALAEAEAQLSAAEARGDLAAIFGDVMGAASTALFGEGDDRGAGYRSEVVGPAEAALEAAKQRLADYKRQLTEIDNIRLTPEGTADRPGDGNGNGNDDDGKKDAYEKATASILKRTAALQAETAAQAGLNPLINDYGFAVEKAKVAQELLAAAQEAGLTITPALKESILALATGYAAASVEADKLAESQQHTRDLAESFRDTAKSALRSFIDDLREGKSATEALGGALNQVADKFLEMGIDAIFGGGQTKDFGLVGKLLGFADGGVASHGRSQPLKKYAGGGVSNTAAIFGEAGPEAAVPLPDGRRIPVDLRVPKSGGRGGDAIAVSVSVGVQNGELIPLITTVSGQVAGRQIEQRTPAIVKQVAPGAVATAQRNRTI